MTDSDIEERVTSLKFWCSRPVIEPLSGGITNRNYRASADGEEFVVRVCDELPHLGIDRKNEPLCQTEAHQAGADMLVTGTYRHNQLIEWFAGGTTRHLLACADIPLLMIH